MTVYIVISDDPELSHTEAIEGVFASELDALRFANKYRRLKVLEMNLEYSGRT